MSRSPHGSAHPHTDSDPRRHGNSSPIQPAPAGPPANGADHTGLDVAALDGVLFTAPFVLLDAHNCSPARVTTLSAVQAALAACVAVSAAGTLRPGVLAADVDAADTGADTEAGLAAAEELRDWAEGYGLPWLLRASGRPGGHHLIVAARDELTQPWAAACHTAATRHQVSIRPRTGMALRLLSAPHRHGLPAPVLDATLSATDLPTPPPTPPPRRPRRRLQRTRTQDVRRPQRPRRGRDRSRSAREFGLACAFARADATATHTWQVIAQPGTHAAERGWAWWRDYVWTWAATIAAAERDDEDAGWHAVEAPGGRARRWGRAWWRRWCWAAARAEALTPRPRRYRTEPDTPPPCSAPRGRRGRPPLDRAAVQRTRRALRAAVNHTCTVQRRRPQWRRSCTAVVDALAVAIVRDGGRASHRGLAQAAGCWPSTIARVLAWLQQHAIIDIGHRHSAGPRDCHSYRPGPATQLAMPSNDHPTDGSRGTRCVAPPNANQAHRVTGRANPHRLRAHLNRQRRAYTARCAAVAEATAAGIRLAQLDTPAARTARSLHAQHRRWQALTTTEQQQCRQARRQYLRTLDPAKRAWWLHRWLPQRRQLQQAMRRVVDGHGHHDDPGMLAGAPMVVHRGLLALPHHPLALPIAVPPPPSARGFGTKRGPGDITAVGGIGQPEALTHHSNAGTPCDPT